MYIVLLCIVFITIYFHWVWIGYRDFFFFQSRFTSFRITPLELLTFFGFSSSYFILVISLRECLEKHSFMGSPFTTAILNGT